MTPPERSGNGSPRRSPPRPPPLKRSHAFTEDLLARYAALMPANPRLIKRVANTFGMLLALGLHLGHHEDEDTIARAAILLVRFPTLVDDLLSAPDPPLLDSPANPSPVDLASSWLRRDVRQVLRRADGSRVDITAIARCYGRHYAPDPTSSPGYQDISALSSSSRPPPLFRGSG